MRRFLHATLRGSFLVLALATRAWAADPPKTSASPTPPPAELIPKVRPTTQTFYGWEILATGEVGGALVAASVLLPDKPVSTPLATTGFVIGMPLFVLGGPTVHWTHGDFNKGLISFGGNIALPLIGGIAGRAFRCHEANAPDDCASRGFLTGIGITAMVTPVIDALALGWESVPVDDALSHVLPQAGGGSNANKLSIAPWSNIGKNGLFQLGFSGRF
jgi:hypothetical protein